ncbi:hypothetical protein Tco_1274303 [Tanacetum coccineum]
MDDGPSSLKKWKDKFFLIDRRAVPDYLTWRHSCSCVSDDLLSDGYDQNDVQQLRARLIHLREMRDKVLVRSGLSSVWFNKECDPAEISIYDFMTLSSWSDSKIVEESHHLSFPLLERVLSHTTAPAAEGAMVSLPTPDEIAASLLDLRLAKKSKGPVQARIEDNLEKDDAASTRDASAPILRLGKRLGAPPSMAVVSAFEPSHVRTLAHASISGRSLSLGGAAVSGHVRKSGAEVLQRQVDLLDFLARSSLAHDVEYDQILKNDFGTATRGEEINLTLFPLAPGLYHMPYPYEGVSSPLYTKKEWDEPHAPECNILCKDIFKDPDVYRKALDRTITHAELRRTESLLPLELSNRVNVISALLVSHGYELNSRYTNLVSSSAHLQEKLDKKKMDVKLLCSKVTSLDNKLENLQRGCDALGQENRDLSKELTQTDGKLLEQALTVRDLQNELVLEKSKSQGYKDAMDGLREKVTQFVGSGVESLVRKLLSSNDFHAALACVASLDINYGVEKGADFDKALDDFPTTPFPFFRKIAAASEEAAIACMIFLHIMLLFIGELSWEGEDWKRISEKRTKNKAKNDKTEHGMKKRESQSQPRQSQRSKSKPKSKKC